MLISLSDLLKSQSPHPDSRILSSFYPLHHRPALQRGFWTQYIVVDTSSGPQHLPYRRRRYVCSKSALAISCRQLAVRPEVRDSCSGMISSRNARQSARICNLASSLGSLPTSASCRPFTSSQRCCAIPLAYARYDPPRSEKPPVVEYPVIILHGLFGNKMNWQAIAKKLKDKLRQSIICVDARNHGESRHDPDNSYEAMSDDVEELVHRLKIPKAILVGHSMGGKVAMCTALRKPAEVDSLIVVDSAPSQSPGLESFKRYISAMKALDLSRDEKIPQLRGRAIKEFEENIPELMVRQFILTNLVENKGKNEWRVNLEAIENNLNNIMEFPLFHNFYGGPVLFIAGDKSDYIGDKEMPEIRRLFPEVVIDKLPGGHWVHADNPKETIASIVRFLKKRETDDADAAQNL